MSGADAAKAYEHLVQTLTEVQADPFAADAEARLREAAEAANKAMYPKHEA